MKSNLTAVHLNHTNDVLRELLRFDRPADVILSRYFRENKKLGQKDRHEIAELTFACLRHLERVKPFIEPDAVTARRVILVTLLKIFHYNLITTSSIYLSNSYISSTTCPKSNSNFTINYTYK
jgi:16S rRNA (cytosine967-C5)-methyltransferase